MTENESGAYFVNTPLTWRERLRFKLFPSEPCLMPSAPATWADCVVVTTVVSLSFRARIMTFISGKLKVETRTVTENIVGDSKTSSVGYPIWKS